MRLQRSSRSWSIECRIPGNLCDLSKGYFATGRKRLTVLLAAQQICLFAKQSATYKGRSLLSAPRSRVGSRRGSGFDDADVSSIPPIIPYGGFSPIRLQG